MARTFWDEQYGMKVTDLSEQTMPTLEQLRYRGQLNDMERKISDNLRAFAAERAATERKAKELRKSTTRPARRSR